MNDPDEDYEEILRQSYAQDARRKAMLARVRVTRNSSVDVAQTPPTSPETQPRRAVVSSGVSSVFGADKRAEKAKERTLQAIIRERARQKATTLELEELRKADSERQLGNKANTNNANADSEYENIRRQMARSANKLMNEDDRTCDKYRSAITMFYKNQSWPHTLSHFTNKSLVSNKVHEHLIGVHAKGKPSDRTFISLMRFWLRFGDDSGQQAIGRMLFHRCVYDDSEHAAGVESRKYELEALLLFVEKVCVGNSNPPRLYSIVRVLRNFGCAPERPYKAIYAIETIAKDESLDKLVMLKMQASTQGEPEHPQPPKVTIASRNLQRAFVIWAKLVSVGADLCYVYGMQADDVPAPLCDNANFKQLSQDAKYAYLIALLCVQLLFSPFGSRLSYSIGTVLEACFTRVPYSEWPVFRRTLAWHLCDSVTTRLFLYADLVATYLPLREQRSRGFALDIAFLALSQWHAGPSESPRLQRNVQWPLKDTAPISFTFTHLIECVNNIPNLTKKSDTVWACAWARLLKFIVLEPAVLATRMDHHFPKLQLFVQNVILQSHRYLDRQSVDVRWFQYELDQMIKGVKAFTYVSKSKFDPTIQDDKR